MCVVWVGKSNIFGARGPGRKKPRSQGVRSPDLLPKVGRGTWLTDPKIQVNVSHKINVGAWNVCVICCLVQLYAYLYLCHIFIFVRVRPICCLSVRDPPYPTSPGNCSGGGIFQRDRQRELDGAEKLKMRTHIPRNPARPEVSLHCVCNASVSAQQIVSTVSSSSLYS